MASSLAGEHPSALPPNPDLFDEFSAEEQTEMMAIRASVHARALESKADPLVRMPVPRPAIASSERTGPTGPRSTEGKATSSGDSLKHGLASGRVIIPGEDPAEFEALLFDLLKEHAPANETEALLVQQMAQSWWLMQRAIRMQNQTFTETPLDIHKLALFLRYQTAHDRAFYRALNSLIKLQKERPKSAPEFVSQKRPHASEPDQFVSQTVTGNIGAPASDKFKFGSVPTLLMRKPRNQLPFLTADG